MTLSLAKLRILGKSAFNREFTQIYDELRPAFIAYFNSRYSFLRTEDIEDIYNDSLLAFYKNIESGKLATLTCSIKSYIYTIGRNKAVDLIRNQHPEAHVSAENIEMYDRVDAIWEEANEAEREKQNAVRHIVNKLVEPCKSILKLFYFQKETMKTIAQQMKYANADVAKSKKNQCMTKVRNTAKDYMQTLGLI